MGGAAVARQPISAAGGEDSNRRSGGDGARSEEEKVRDREPGIEGNREEPGGTRRNQEEPGIGGNREKLGGAGLGAVGTNGRERWEPGLEVSAGRAAAGEALGPRAGPWPLTARGALSEVVAAEAVCCLNRAMATLRDIWEEIGIPEEQRLERTDTVRKHIKVRGGGSPVLVLSRVPAAQQRGPGPEQLGVRAPSTALPGSSTGPVRSAGSTGDPCPAVTAPLPSPCAALSDWAPHTAHTSLVPSRGSPAVLPTLPYLLSISTPCL